MFSSLVLWNRCFYSATHMPNLLPEPLQGYCMVLQVQHSRLLFGRELTSGISSLGLYLLRKICSDLVGPNMTIYHLQHPYMHKFFLPIAVERNMARLQTSKGTVKMIIFCHPSQFETHLMLNQVTHEFPRRILVISIHLLSSTQPEEKRTENSIGIFRFQQFL